ncbi:MAG TPA: HAMP domain-containing sensor histidine kinase [Dehalococcoidia bacterium]|nr:HAMP domain-containing sensor histidine kinase [Dehalococcoidia bacterium]
MMRLRGLLPPWRPPPAGADRPLFRRARLQPTAWYVLTLMLVVVGFSAVVYGILAARLPGHHHERHEPASKRATERETANFVLGELRIYLLLGNAGLLVLGSAGAYLLAGRTLRLISDAMARQRRFTADASHELRTPLTVMRGSIDVALSRERPAADYRAVLEEVGEEVDGMTVLIEHLLQLARGAPPSAPQPIDLREVLADVERAMQPIAAERRSALLIGSGARSPVRADRAALRAVLINLVSNALQHSPPGTTVRVRAADDERGMAVQVVDDGLSIPPEERERVFLPFYRLNTAGADGHGLGLALTRELVTAAGGTIAIGETPGGGATVHIWLPRAAAAAALAAPNPYSLTPNP